MKYIFSFIMGICCSMNLFAHTYPYVTLRDKIGQMLLIGFDGKKVDPQSAIVKTIQKNNIGGVILFDYDKRTQTKNKNIESPRQVKLLTHDLQYLASRGNLKHNRAQLPLLISIDYEGGKVERLKTEYGFPSTFSAAEVGKKSVDEAESIAAAMASTLHEAGFNLNFAPVLDVNVNPKNPIIGKKDRSFSSNATTVAEYAGIYTRHFLNQNIQCAYKHFPGHGSSTQDSHLGFVDVSKTWKSYELQPYKMRLNSDASCGMIMTAHIVNRQLDESGLPATLSHKILTKLLRQQLGFNGVIITDDMQMKAISENYDLEEALVLSINAGADMLIFGNNLPADPQDPEKLIDLIESKVISGEIPIERINDAYEHIVTLKKSIKTND